MVFRFSSLDRSIIFILLTALLLCGCSASGTRTAGNDGDKAPANVSSNGRAPADERSKGSTITIEENSPADTVRVFYKSLREKDFRKAMYLTNLRPAMEGLTDTELKEFQIDFNDVATRVPAEIEINGEVISGDAAVVTANLPGDDPELLEIQQIKLRRENGVWLILTVDEKAEAMIKKEGKNYFYALRIDTHEAEVKKLLQKIADAQSVLAAKDGKYNELQTLVDKNLVPADIFSAESTGYNFVLRLKDDGKGYFATATPAVYAKTGKLSFLLETDKKLGPRISSKDLGGKPVKN
jgi:hypothetical protein